MADSFCLSQAAASAIFPTPLDPRIFIAFDGPTYLEVAFEPGFAALESDTVALVRPGLHASMRG